jgi:2-succinyl-6-hydroxy-2,4-cyclohexadiene-1-carboxylate synthase
MPGPISSLEIAGLSYAFSVTGSGELPTLVLLHGFTGSTASWGHVLPELSSSRQVLALDLPGHGYTPAPSDPQRIQFEQVAADLAQLIARITPPRLGQVDILGYSMGGRLALFFALRFPNLVRRLVLESASPGLADPQERQARQRSDEALARRIEEQGIQAFVNEWENLPLFTSQAQLPAAVRAGLRQQRLQNNPAGLAASLRGMGTGVQPSLWPLLPSLQPPALLLTGELDNKFTAINRQMRDVIPACTWQRIPAVGHTPHLENPGVFLAQVLVFLGR